MQRKTIIASLLASGVVLASPGMADMASPAMLSNTCAGCHGTHGVSSGPSIPTIAGLDSEYFVKVMQDYRSGEATSTIMGRIAKGYTDEQIKAMAGFYAAQSFVTPVQQYDKKRAKPGAKLHRKYCEACHEEGGRESDEAGILAGQWMPYLTAAIADFRAGRRDMPRKMQRNLKKVVAKYGEKGVDALIQFYGSRTQ